MMKLALFFFLLTACFVCGAFASKEAEVVFKVTRLEKGQETLDNYRIVLKSPQFGDVYNEVKKRLSAGNVKLWYLENGCRKLSDKGCDSYVLSSQADLDRAIEQHKSEGSVAILAEAQQGTYTNTAKDGSWWSRIFNTGDNVAKAIGYAEIVLRFADAVFSTIDKFSGKKGK